MSVISSGTLIVSGVTSSNLEIVEEGVLRILDEGFATRIGVSGGGRTLVSSGGTLYICSAGSGGAVTVLDSGYAQRVTVENGGVFILSSGGIAHRNSIQSGGTHIAYDMTTSAEVMAGGVLHVSSGGFARYAVVSQGGVVDVWNGGQAHQTLVNGLLRVNRNGAANFGTVEAGGVIEIMSGGNANETSVGAGGRIDVSSGGVIYMTSMFEEASATVFAGGSSYMMTLKGGRFTLQSGASADRTTVSSGGQFELTDGAAATSMTVNSGGVLEVRSGGSARAVRENGGYVSFEEGANVGFASNTFSGVELNGASATVHSGTTAASTVLNGGTLEVFAGGSAVGTTVGSGGRLEVKNGGVATDVIWTPCVGSVTSAEGAQVTFASAYAGVYYGSRDELVSSAPVLESRAVGELETMYVFSGGTAVDLSAQSGGRVVVSGGTLTGSVTVGTGADVSVCEGAELNFDLRRTSAGAGAFANDLSAIRGALLYTLTVNGDLKPGKYDYSLADGADAFSGAITVRTADGETLGELTPGEKTVLGGVEYLLILAASNLSVTVDVPDVTPPEVRDILVTPDTPTNQDVLVTAVFSDDAGDARGLYRFEGEELWSDYLDGVVVTRNTTVYLKAVDGAGLESEAVPVAVTNIDKDPPVITLDADPLTPARRTTLTAGTEPGIDIYYSRDGGAWTLYTGTIEVTENGAYDFAATDAVGNTGTAGIVFENIYPAAPQNPVGTADRVSWDPVGAERYILEYSTDRFEHGIRAATAGSAVDMFGLPAGTWQWRVRADDSDEWAVGDDIESGGEPAGAAEVVRSNSDGAGDIFFATPDGVWGDFYAAKHAGSRNDWSGTGEIVSATGRGRIHNLYFGSDDLNVLYLTDGENGDAIFVDDAYTELPEGVTAQSRLAKIREIRAGAGNDIVDLTSREFEYTGAGMTIRGGDGDDTLWANKGANMLFGDAGNDRIVGASGDDAIVGGTGDDSMHGGGGDDVFVFCVDWGTDTVRQLETGSVTLWFVSGSFSNWNPSTMTYTDSSNSVRVEGVASNRIEFKFGSDGSDEYARLADAGAFDAFSSARIFEAEGTGILASL